MRASAELRILREVGRQAPFRICRALRGDLPALAWCVRRPGFSPRAAEAPYLRLAGQKGPAVVTFLGTEWSQGEYRVVVGAPPAEDGLEEWLARGPDRAGRMAVATDLARAAAWVASTGCPHGGLGPGSFMVDPEGRAWLVDYPARPIVRGADGRPPSAAADARSLGALLCLVLTGRTPTGEGADATIPPEVPSGLRGAVADLLLGDGPRADAAMAGAAGRLEAVAEREAAGARAALPSIGAAWREGAARWSRWAALAVFLWAAIEILRLLAFFPGVARIPAVRGEPRRTAVARLRAAGLRAEVEGYESAPGVPRDAVARTDPAQGRPVREGTRVGVWLSSGEAAGVPDLAGLDASAATRRLLQAGYSVGRIVLSESTLAVPGTVAATTPPAGEEAVPGQAIDLWVSVSPGDETGGAPDGRGGAAGGALAAWRAEGFTVGGAVRVTRRRRPGRQGEAVASQSPAPGDEIAMEWPGDLLLVVETASETGAEWAFETREMPGWVARGALRIHLQYGDHSETWEEPWDPAVRRPAFVTRVREALATGTRPLVLTIAQSGRVAWTTRFE